MTGESLTHKRRLFREYYLNRYTPENVVLPDLKFRHFRFQLFSEKTRFLRLLDVVNSPAKLCHILTRYVPMNAYFTPVKWLNPVYVAHTKEELDVMLSSPLYFDIDMQDLIPPIFSEAKRNTIRLIQFLEDEYARQPDLLVFSGRQGFHIYFWKWDSYEIFSLNPQDRLIRFKRKREEILATLRKRKIIVDERITPDPFRIMKIPNSLHGKTGFIAKPVMEVQSFNPKEEARAFDLEVYDKIFKVDWSIYE